MIFNTRGGRDKLKEDDTIHTRPLLPPEFFSTRCYSSAGPLPSSASYRRCYCWWWQDWLDGRGRRCLWWANNGGGKEEGGQSEEADADRFKVHGGGSHVSTPPPIPHLVTPAGPLPSPSSGFAAPRDWPTRMESQATLPAAEQSLRASLATGIRGTRRLQVELVLELAPLGAGDGGRRLTRWCCGSGEGEGTGRDASFEFICNTNEENNPRHHRIRIIAPTPGSPSP